MFKIDSYVVYRKDVCKITNITNKYNNLYYELSPINDNSLKIDVLTSNNDSIRELISKEDIYKIINSIPSIKTIDLDNKYIENEYKELLKNSTHEDLISIIKTAYLRNNERIKQNKKLSDKDKNYFEKAEEYLYNEFSIVLNMNYDDTKKFVIDKVKELIEND